MSPPHSGGETFCFRAGRLDVCPASGTKLCLRLFSETIAWISMKLYMNTYYQAQLRISSGIFDRTFFGGVMGLCCFFRYITYRGKHLSTLVLLNHCLDFNETLHEHLVPSLVVHIVRNFRLDVFWQSYGTLLFSLCSIQGKWWRWGETSVFVTKTSSSLSWYYSSNE